MHVLLLILQSYICLDNILEHFIYQFFRLIYNFYIFRYVCVEIYVKIHVGLNLYFSRTHNSCQGESWVVQRSSLLGDPCSKKSFFNPHFIIYGKSNACTMISLNSQKFAFLYLPLVSTAFVQVLYGFQSKTYCLIYVFTLVWDPLFFCLKLLTYGVCQTLLKVQDDREGSRIQNSLQKCILTKINIGYLFPKGYFTHAPMKSAQVHGTYMNSHMLSYWLLFPPLFLTIFSSHISLPYPPPVPPRNS